MAIYSGFSHEKMWFSIAMLNYQRVWMMCLFPSIWWDWPQLRGQQLAWSWTSSYSVPWWLVASWALPLEGQSRNIYKLDQAGSVLVAWVRCPTVVCSCRVIFFFYIYIICQEDDGNWLAANVWNVHHISQIRSEGLNLQSDNDRRNVICKWCRVSGPFDMTLQNNIYTAQQMKKRRHNITMTNHGPFGMTMHELESLEAALALWCGAQNQLIFWGKSGKS